MLQTGTKKIGFLKKGGGTNMDDFKQEELYPF